MFDEEVKFFYFNQVEASGMNMLMRKWRYYQKGGKNSWKTAEKISVDSAKMFLIKFTKEYIHIFIYKMMWKFQYCENLGVIKLFWGFLMGLTIKLERN